MFLPLLLGVCSLTGCVATLDGSTQRVAKDIPLETLAGHQTHLSSLRGTYVLAHFWATWCATCHDELRSLDELAHAIDTLTVVAIAVEDESAAVRDFIAREGITIPVLLDLGQARGAYGIPSIPFTVLLDPAGRRHPFIDPATGEVVSHLAVARSWATPTAIERLRQSVR